VVSGRHAAAIDQVAALLWSRADCHSSWSASPGRWPMSTGRGPVIGAAAARWDKDAPGGLGLPAESDVLGAVARGLSIRQAARLLGIAPRTVENVQTRLFRKLGVCNRSGALAVADAFGLVPEPASADPEMPGDEQAHHREPVPSRHPRNPHARAEPLARTRHAAPLKEAWH
jgi:DNA-binding CsgD family transcriptional regulator